MYYFLETDPPLIPNVQTKHVCTSFLTALHAGVTLTAKDNKCVLIKKVPDGYRPDEAILVAVIDFNGIKFNALEGAKI